MSKMGIEKEIEGREGRLEVVRGRSGEKDWRRE